MVYVATRRATRSYIELYTPIVANAAVIFILIMKFIGSMYIVTA